MIRFLYVLCGAWIITPVIVGAMGGSLFWVIGSFLIGGAVVFGWMGLISLLDGSW